jgi:hypothetical protein
MNRYRVASVAGAWAALCIFTVACGGSQDDGQSAGADLSGAPTAAAAPEIVPGVYVLDNSDVGATLTIHMVSKTSLTYDLGVLGKTGSQHNGELDQRTAKPSGSTFNDTVDSDCKIVLSAASADSVQVKQTGSCSDAGFGAFLDGSGVYKRKPDGGAPPAADGWVGLYETETTHRAWAIRITSESPFKFHLFAGHLEDASERVDAKDLTGTVSGDTVTSENGPDCTLKLSKSDIGGIDVVQDGTCAVLGFPMTGDLEMSDSSDPTSSSHFQKIDETTECFDTQELAISIAKCQSPL